MCLVFQFQFPSIKLKGLVFNSTVIYQQKMDILLTPNQNALQ